MTIAADFLLLSLAVLAYRAFFAENAGDELMEKRRGLTSHPSTNHGDTDGIAH